VGIRRNLLLKKLWKCEEIVLVKPQLQFPKGSGKIPVTLFKEFTSDHMYRQRSSKVLPSLRVLLPLEDSR